MGETLYATLLYLKKEFQNINFSFGPNLQIGLLKQPMDTSGVISEVSGGAYSRINMPRTDTNWSIDSNGYVINANDIVFNRAASDWREIAGIFITESNQPSKALYYYNFTEKIYVAESDTLTLKAGSIKIGRKEEGEKWG